MKKNFSVAVLLIVMALLFTACKKDPVKPGDGGNAPGTDSLPDAQLQILLNGPYLPASKIDSALAIWEVAGASQTVNLQVSGNKLVTALANFANSGSGLLTLQLFTQTKVRDMPLQWEQRLAYTINRKSAVQVSAPVDLKGPFWNPRAISRSEIYGANATIIIALRPEDAYFELKDVDTSIAKRIEVVRSFYLNDTTNLVASRGWVGGAGNLDGKGGYINRDRFADLPGQMAGRAWNKYKIRASFYAALAPARIYETEFVEDKP